MSLRRPRTGAVGLRQRGFALIAMLALAAMITAFLIAIGLNRNSTELANEREDRNMKALRQAKDALIAYAASEQWQFHFNPPPPPASNTGYFQPGSLPCPDKDDDDGAADCTGSTSRSMIGRLPWKTLGIDDLRDASGERIWYAVSHDFRKMACPASNCTTVNSDTQGQLAVTDSVTGVVTSNVVAVLIAPGLAIQGQTRPANLTSAGHNDPANYAESFSAGDWVHFNFATSSLPPNSTYNDRLLTITQAEIMAAVEPVVAAQLARDVRPLLTAYSAQWGVAYPFPARFDNPDPGTNGGSTTRSPMAFLGDPTRSSGLLPISAVPVSAASNASPIVITTAAPHTLSTGDAIWVAGVQGNTAANGKWTVTVVDSTHFQLNGSSGSGGYNSGGAVTLAYPWSNWSVNKSGGSGRIDNDNCSPVSSPFPGLQCTFRARDDDCGFTNCISNLRFRLQARVGQNAGRALAVLPDTSDVLTTIDGGNSSFFSVSISGSLDTAGVGTVTYTARLPISCFNTCSDHDIAVTVPDVVTNTALSATDPGLGWFIANEWYRQTYYALAPDFQPGGNGNCNFNPPCLTVNKLPGGATTNSQAILLVAGRVLNGSPRPSSSLNNYLEGQNQTASATHVYETRIGSPTSINDRVVVVSP